MVHATFRETISRVDGISTLSTNKLTSSSTSKHSVLDMDYPNYRRFSTSPRRKLKKTSTKFPLTGTISFHNISYIPNVNRIKIFCSKLCQLCKKPRAVKQVLNDVSGVFKTGMNAVMGEYCFIERVRFSSELKSSSTKLFR